MENTFIISKVLIICTVLLWALPFVLGLCSSLVNFWSRDRVNKSWGLDFYRYVNQKFGVEERWSVDSEYTIAWLLFPSLLSILALVLEEFLGIWTLAFVGGLLGLLYLPRFILDISNSIKYNFKTRDADRIKELEQRLSNLEK